MFRKHWIPPVPLAFAQLAFALSWWLLFDIARRGAEQTSFEAFAWVHTIVLAWVTTIALSVLLHVLPNFVDVLWRGENIARASVYGFMAGAVLLTGGFLAENTSVISLGATLTFVALAFYASCALATLAQAFRSERLERAVARAFSLTIVFLLVTAILGVVFAFALQGLVNAHVLVHGPAAHAVLGIGGWLTMLVAGVSARTMRPMSGTRSRFPVLHIVGSTALLAGIILAAIGIAISSATTALRGFIIGAIGATLYSWDIADILRRASNPHLAPRLLMFFGSVCSVCAAIFGAASVLGADLGAAAVYLALIGWIGSAVLAHLHHLGVRVMLTLVLGDDDETRPWEVLNARLTWATAAVYVLAVVLGTIGWATHNAAWIEPAAVCGLLSWLIMVINVTRASRMAQSRAAQSYSLV